MNPQPDDLDSDRMSDDGCPNDPQPDTTDE
jgi:hypothetical protein